MEEGDQIPISKADLAAGMESARRWRNGGDQVGKSLIGDALDMNLLEMPGEFHQSKFTL